VAGVRAALKWPNDVLVDGVKVGGILSELIGDAAVVGLGINLSWAPEGAGCLGPAVDRDELLAAFLAGLETPGDVLTRYRARCATLGRQVRVELPDSTLEGIAEAVDDQGRLVVDGREITAGDVVHLR
jgi:BirA family biotin operon repressor/biotin-[acetyl-CoA-carboxylase] ligase